MEEWMERGGLRPERRFGGDGDLRMIWVLWVPIIAGSRDSTKPSSMLRAASSSSLVNRQE
jgi:hypothetical protein